MNREKELGHTLHPLSARSSSVVHVFENQKLQLTWSLLNPIVYQVTKIFLLIFVTLQFHCFIHLHNVFFIVLYFLGRVGQSTTVHTLHPGVYSLFLYYYVMKLISGVINYSPLATLSKRVIYLSGFPSLTGGFPIVSLRLTYL